MLALVVVHPFGPYEVSQHITDEATIDAIRSGANAAHVVPVNLPDPAPEAKAETPAEPQPEPAPDAGSDDKSGAKPSAKSRG